MKKIGLTFLLIIFALTLFSCDIIHLNLPENLNAIRAKYDAPMTFISTGTSASRQARTTPSLYIPWDDSLYMLGTVDTRIYNINDSIPLNFKVGMNDSILSDGDLRITIFADEYTARMSGTSLDNNTYTIKDFFSPDAPSRDKPLEFTISLSPNFDDIWAAGTIHVQVEFVPHDMQAFKEQMSEYPVYDIEELLHDERVFLVSDEISYAADPLEIWINRGSSHGDNFNDITKYHYEKGLITTEQMAECFFEYKQHNSVNVYVYYHDETTHSMNIGYFSKNIRYASTYSLTDSELEEAILAHEAFWYENHYHPAKGGLAVAERILEIMRERGVITEAEYYAELNELENAKGVYAQHSEHNSFFPSSKYEEVNDLCFTHHD